MDLSVSSMYLGGIHLLLELSDEYHVTQNAYEYKVWTGPEEMKDRERKKEQIKEE